MNILVSYDLENDRLRTRFSNQLLSLGLLRIQYSVFMGNLNTPYRTKLEGYIQELIQAKDWQAEDAILLLPLYEYNKNNMKSWGKLPDDWDLINDPPHTLFL